MNSITTSVHHVAPHIHHDLTEPPKPAKQHVRLTEEQEQQLIIVAALLAPHKGSGRAQAIYFVFKYLATGCLIYKQFNPTQRTIGIELKRYGYDKTLGTTQIKIAWRHLLDAGLFTVERLNGKLNRYTLTELGYLAFYKIAEGNRGAVIVQAPVFVDEKDKMSPSNKKTDPSNSKKPTLIHRSYYTDNTKRTKSYNQPQRSRSFMNERKAEKEIKRLGIPIPRRINFKSQEAYELALKRYRMVKRDLVDRMNHVPDREA